MKNKANKISIKDVTQLIGKMDEFEKEFTKVTIERKEYDAIFSTFKSSIIRQYAEFIFEQATKMNNEISVSEYEFAMEYFITIEQYEHCSLLHDFMNKKIIPENNIQ